MSEDTTPVTDEADAPVEAAAPKKTVAVEQLVPVKSKKPTPKEPRPGDREPGDRARTDENVQTVKIKTGPDTK